MVYDTRPARPREGADRREGPRCGWRTSSNDTHRPWGVRRSTSSASVVSWRTTAIPYAWPVACGLRLARRLGVPFLLTPFLHLGDPDDPNDRTRRAYTAPPFLMLLRAAYRVFVQTAGEFDAVRRLGVPEERVVL